MTTVTPIINDKDMISKVNMLEDIIKANKKHIKERDGYLLQLKKALKTEKEIYKVKEKELLPTKNAL